MAAIVLALGCGLALGVPLGAQEAGTQPAKAAGAGSANQRAADLLNTINKGEIATGQLMEGHAQNSQVKDFATMVVNDHQNAENQLQSAASQSNISLKVNPMMKKQDDSLENRLKSESGTQADKAYVNAEVRDHAQAINRLKSLEPSVTDPQIKSNIAASLPVMQKHLDAAKKLQGTLSSSGSGK